MIMNRYSIFQYRNMTTFNPFDTPNKSISDSQSGTSQFDALMFQPKIDWKKLTEANPFAFDVITTTNNKLIIALLMEDTIDSVE